VHHQDYYNAATVQLELAKSEALPIPLSKRIEYLSRAKANASIQSSGIGRQARQVLLHEVTELLEVANIQDELLHRLRADERIAPERRPDITLELDGLIRNLSELYNGYADQASYFDICLTIYEAADHRNNADINATWQSLLEATHAKVANDPNAAELPYEAVINMFRDMANRLNHSESTFPPTFLIPLIEKYALESQRGVGSPTWVVDLFLSVSFHPETILSVLQEMFYNDIAPFTGRNKAILPNHMLYTIQQWYHECVRNNQRLFGGDENARAINELLSTLIRSGLSPDDQEQATELMKKIGKSFR